MRRFLKRLFSTGRCRRAHPLPASQVAPEWTATEQADWKRFLASQTGQVLQARGQALAAVIALRAGEDAINPGHAAVRAAGFNDCLRWLDSLSRVTGDQVTEPTAEQPPEGEAELLERLSP
ncbi:MAG: hypothetical protein KGL39_21330 [Patescibacteria group bacterium]|nr:hypothetical protein [Patescibacteria group bacterium]